MPFNEINRIESADRYLDIAIKKANKKVAQAKFLGNQLNKIKTKDMRKIEIIKDDLIARMDSLAEQFPDMSELSDLYRELIKITIGSYKLNKIFRDIRWSRQQIIKFYKFYNRNIKSARDMAEMLKAKRSYYGRVSSVIKNIDFLFLENARKTLQSFPTIKSKYKQVAIAGFPNVGKSTLLSKLSGSKPEIAAYPFTTKSIMIGYSGDIQLLDTPGTLNRFNKMNYIEQQAFLVVKVVAEKIIYIFDLTEPYPLKNQIRLLKRIREFHKPIIIYLSKTDILEKEEIEEFKKRFNVITDIKTLKTELEKWSKTSTPEPEKR